MSKTKEKFKAAFRRKSTNYKLYTQRRQAVSVPLGSVCAILQTRGVGDLPEDSLEDIAAQYDRQVDSLLQLDILAKTDPTTGLATLLDLEPPAVSLQADAERDSSRIEQRTRLLREDKELFEERLAATKNHLSHIEQQHGPRPQATWDRISALDDLVSRNEFVQATGGLNPILRTASDLDSIFTQMMRLPIPDDLSSEDRDLMRGWKAAIITAVEKSDEETARAELGKYKAMVFGKERREQVAVELSGLDPDVLYRQRILRIEDVVGYPPALCSAALLTHQTNVRDARTNYLIKETTYVQARDTRVGLPGDAPRRELLAAAFDERESRKAAQEALDALDEVLTPAGKAFTEHEKQMKPYYKALKKLGARIALADALPTTDTNGDTPWKAEREAYDAKKAELKLAVDAPARNYELGNTRLAELKLLIDALVAKKVAQVDTLITGASEGAAARTLVNDLDATPGLIAALSGEQHLKILLTLRTKARECRDCNVTRSLDEDVCSACNSGTFDDLISEDQMNDARKKMFAKMQLDPTFEIWDTQKREQTITSIRELEEFAEAEEAFPDDVQKRTKWQVWASDPDTYGDKIIAFFDKCLDAQCKILGHDMKNLTREGSDETWPDRPVKAKLAALPATEFGGCTVGFPTWIKINKNHSQFADFKEMVDTIVHENAHAWQEWTIAVLNEKPPFNTVEGRQKKNEILNDGNIAVHAQLLQENDKTYYDDGKAYRHETIEEQAWLTGGTVSTRLLVPPPVESFESKRTLASKTFVAESITKAQQCIVKLRDRHGIYVDEWQGEEASDKRLTLEFLRNIDGTVAAPQPVRIARGSGGVVDEYTLKLDFDTRTLFKTKEGKDDELAADAAKLRLSEMVADL